MSTVQLVGQPGVYLKLRNGTTGYMRNNFYTGWKLSGAFVAKNSPSYVDSYFVNAFIVETGSTQRIHYDEIEGNWVVDWVGEDSETPVWTLEQMKQSHKFNEW